MWLQAGLHQPNEGCVAVKCFKYVSYNSLESLQVKARNMWTLLIELFIAEFCAIY